MKAIIVAGLLALPLAACEQPLSPTPLPGYPCYVEIIGNDNLETLVPVSCEGRIPERLAVDD